MKKGDKRGNQFSVAEVEKIVRLMAEQKLSLEAAQQQVLAARDAFQAKDPQAKASEAALIKDICLSPEFAHRLCYVNKDNKLVVSALGSVMATQYARNVCEDHRLTKCEITEGEGETKVTKYYLGKKIDKEIVFVKEKLDSDGKLEGYIKADLSEAIPYPADDNPARETFEAKYFPLKYQGEMFQREILRVGQQTPKTGTASLPKQPLPVPAKASKKATNR